MEGGKSWKGGMSRKESLLLTGTKASFGPSTKNFCFQCLNLSQTHRSQAGFRNDEWRQYTSFVRPGPLQKFTPRTKASMDAIERLTAASSSITAQEEIMKHFGVRFWNHGFLRVPTSVIKDPFSIAARDHTHITLEGNDKAEGAAMLHSAVCIHKWCSQIELRERIDYINTLYSGSHGRLPDLGSEFFTSIHKADSLNVTANNPAGWWMNPGKNTRLLFASAHFKPISSHVLNMMPQILCHVS